MAQSNDKCDLTSIDIARVFQDVGVVDDLSNADFESFLPVKNSTTIDANILTENHQNICTAAEFEFKITEEPQEKFNFCFHSQIKVYLRGVNSKRRLRTYPKIALQFQCSNTRHMVGELFVRCTLQQFSEIAGEISCISPHLLWRCSDNCDFRTSEDVFFPLTKEAPNLYTFTMEEFVILSTSRKDWLEVVMRKWRLLRMSDLDNSSEEIAYRRIANKHLCKPQNKVRLCFDVYQKDNNDEFIRIAGPFFSNCISNGQAPHITKICNTWGFINEISDVTLLIASVKPKDKFSIIISEMKDDADGDKDVETLWKTVIPLQDQMFNDEKSAITFQMPIYGGRQYNLKRINCKIQLERWTDGALSNDEYFEYKNKLKRRYNNSNMGVYENDSDAVENRARLDLMN